MPTDHPDNHPDYGPCDGFLNGRCYECALVRGDLPPAKKRTKAELERELGELYATIFGDGGHRQAACDALPDVPEELWEGQPTGRTHPARYVAAVQELSRRSVLIGDYRRLLEKITGRPVIAF